MHVHGTVRRTTAVLFFALLGGGGGGGKRGDFAYAVENVEAIVAAAASSRRDGPA